MLARAVFAVVVALVLAAGAGCSADNEDPTGPDAGEVGDPLPFMSECQSNDQCETDLCFSFNAKGPHCTHSCMMDADCEAPSPGCNNMGVCKAPDL